MPIFIQYDGIDGEVVSPHRRSANRTMGDGSVRFIKGGINTSLGVLAKAGPGTLTLANTNAVEVSSISLPESPAYSIVIDRRSADAVIKARMLFDAHRSGGAFTLTFNGQVTGGANNSRGINNLRQIALSSLIVPRIEIFVSNCGNSKAARVQLANAKFKEFTVTKKTDTAAAFILSFGYISYD